VHMHEFCTRPIRHILPAEHISNVQGIQHWRRVASIPVCSRSSQGAAAQLTMPLSRENCCISHAHIYLHHDIVQKGVVSEHCSTDISEVWHDHKHTLQREAAQQVKEFLMQGFGHNVCCASCSCIGFLHTL